MRFFLVIFNKSCKIIERLIGISFLKYAMVKEPQNHWSSSHHNEQIKSYSFLLPRKCMANNDVFSDTFFNLSLGINKSFTKTKLFSHGNSFWLDTLNSNIQFYTQKTFRLFSCFKPCVELYIFSNLPSFSFIKRLPKILIRD
jgi:hypothetical protein